MSLNTFDICLLELYEQSLKQSDPAVTEHLLQALEAHSKMQPAASDILAKAYLGGVFD